MRVYLVSLAAGILVGIVYGVLNVRSPAPPVVALVGLLGILLGEQVPPLAQAAWRRLPPSAWMDQVRPHVFGHLPKAERDKTGDRG